MPDRLRGHGGMPVKLLSFPADGKEILLSGTGLAIPPDMTKHELPADEEKLEFWGKLLGAVDTDNGDRLRWAELRLYKITDTDPAHDDSLPDDDEDKAMFGRQLWLLYTIGHSLVYHHADGCNKGVEMDAAAIAQHAEAPADLEPCQECRPGDWRAAGTRSRLEITWYSYTRCQSAAKVIRALYREPRCDACHDKPHEGARCRRCGCESYAEAPRMLSVPGRRLIEQVKHLDPQIAQAAVKVRRF